MSVSRRRFVALVGQLGLLTACQSAPQPQAPTSAAAAAAPPAASSKPVIAPVASVSPATAAAASPVAAASPSVAPSAAAATSPAARPAASPAASASPSPVPAAASASGVAGKPMYQMDALHTGRSPYTGPRQLTLLRSIDLTSPSLRSPDQASITTPDIQSSTAVGPDGTIYATTFAGWTYALRDSSSAKDQLELAWRFRPAEGGGPFHGTPALSRDGSTIYVGYAVGTGAAQKVVLYALKAPSSGQDAQVVWQTDLGPGGAQNSPTVTADGTIYYVDVLGLLSALDPTGNVKWTVQTGTTGDAPYGQTVKVAPAVAPDGTVYTTAITGSLYAISSPTGGGNQGSIKWSFDFGQHLGPTPLMSSPVTSGGNRGQDAIGSAASATIGPDGSIYVGANNSNFYAIAPDGSMKWLYEAQRELAGIWTTAALSADASALYFGANKGGVYALNTRDGALRWQFPTYGSIYASAALDNSGKLYVGTTDESVFGIDTASGQSFAEYAARSPVWSAPSIRPDSSVVIATRDSHVLVLA